MKLFAASLFAAGLAGFNLMFAVRRPAAGGINLMFAVRRATFLAGISFLVRSSQPYGQTAAGLPGTRPSITSNKTLQYTTHDTLQFGCNSTVIHYYITIQAIMHYSASNQPG